MIIPTYWCKLETETEVAIQVQGMMEEHPGDCTFEVQDNSLEVQQQALAELDALSQELATSPA